MSPDNIARAKTLWWIAFAAQAILTMLQVIDRDYLKAASAACLGLTFLMLATGFTADGPEKPFWTKAVVVILAAASIGLLIYRFVGG